MTACRGLLIAIFSTTLSIILMACAGGSNSEVTPNTRDKSAPATTSLPAEDPTAIPARDAGHETGLVVKEILLEPGEYGGKMTFTIANSSDKQCTGPLVMFDLLLKDKSIASTMGIPSHSPLDPGDEKVLNQRYVGIGVVEASVTGTTCENNPAND